MLRGGAPFKSRMATSAVLRAEVVNGHQRSADNASAEITLCDANKGAFAVA